MQAHGYRGERPGHKGHHDTHPMKQPWLYQNEAWPLWHGWPGWVTLTQPLPAALDEQESVLASQPT